MTGTGPYKFVKYVTDQYIEFERYDGFFLGQPKIKKIILRFAPIDTGMAMLQSGEVDLVYDISYGDIDRLAKAKNLVIEEVPNSKFVWWIRYNLLQKNPSPIKKHLQNSDFRRAITMAFDKQAYVDSILLGHGKVVDSNAYSVPWAVPPEFKPTPYDPAKAKELFKKIGWNFDKDTIRILIYPSNKARDQVAGILQNYLRTIGVKSEVINKDLAAARVDMYETFDYDVLVGGWLQGADPSFWNAYLAGPSAGGGRGAEGYDNPKVNELFKKGEQSFNFPERQKIYWEIVKLVQEDMPKSPICLPNVVIGRNAKLNGFVLAPERGLGARFVDVHNWSLDR
jgi:peptide/nickel transport system substrate-binding protein